MDPLTIAMIASAAGQFASSLPGLFSKSPEEKANKYYKNIPEQLQKYISPYIQQFNDLAQNPTGKLNELGSGYKESPGYQFALKQALQAGNNAAAAGGMLGTPAHQQQSMDIASGLASRDFENYLNHAMNLYGSGLGGGFSASKGLGEDIASLMSQQGQIAALGQQQNTQNWSNLFGGTASILPFLFQNNPMTTARNQGAAVGAAGANFGGFK